LDLQDFTACIKTVFVWHPQVHEHHFIVLVAFLIHAMAILILKELLYGKISITSLINIEVYFLLPQIACETFLFILVQILVVHSLIQRIKVYIDISEHLLKDH
jgi:hypothetical protein